MPKISQSPLSDRTHQVEHWGCGCVPIVLASDDMQASAVEAIDTAHHCSSQRPCLGRMRQCGTHCQLVCPQFQCPRQSVVGPDVRLMCTSQETTCKFNSYDSVKKYLLYSCFLFRIDEFNAISFTERNSRPDRVYCNAMLPISPILGMIVMSSRTLKQ